MPEPCDICAKGLERTPGAIGTLRCRGCHDDQLKQVVAACADYGWPGRRVKHMGREVARVESPVGRVHLTDMTDLDFLLADVGRVFERAA